MRAEPFATFQLIEDDMKKLVCILAIVSTPALAQQQMPTPDQYQAAIQALRVQREQAYDQVIQLNVTISTLQKEIGELKAPKPKTEEQAPK